MYPVLLLPVVAVLVHLYRRFTRISLADIPGPKSSSFLLGEHETQPNIIPHKRPTLGNSKELFQSSAGEQEFEWQNQFGGIARIKASFGVGNHRCIVELHAERLRYEGGSPLDIRPQSAAVCLPNRWVQLS